MVCVGGGNLAAKASTGATLFNIVELKLPPAFRGFRAISRRSIQTCS